LHHQSGRNEWGRPERLRANLICEILGSGSFDSSGHRFAAQARVLGFGYGNRIAVAKIVKAVKQVCYA